MAANKIDEILKHFPDLEDGWKEMEERFKKDSAEREMLSLKYQQMLERERLKENLPEPEFMKTKKAETTSKVTPKVTSKVSDDLEQAIDIYLATYFGGEKEKQDWPFLKKMAIHFAEWQKEQLMTKAVKVNISNASIVSLPVNCDLKVDDKVLIIKKE